MIKNKTGQIALFIFTALVSSLFIIPFLWMFLASLKDLTQLYKFPPSWIPNPIQWSNYTYVFSDRVSIGQAFYNSIKIAVIATFFQVMTAAMAGFSFAKIKFPGKEIVFTCFLAAMMIPDQVTMIPSYILYQYLGLLNTHASLIIPGSITGTVGIFMMRQFFRTTPDSLSEAAVIDGANMPTIFFRIMMPLVAPAISALSIFTFMNNWNNFFTPMLYLSTSSKYTLPIMLAGLRNSDFRVDWCMVMAACSVAVIPVLVVYIAGQKYIIEGIALSGTKG